jgi:acyl-homoserine lactone acylase PvdQ
MSEIPQVLDPPSGWLQNCNSTPFTSTSDGNPDPAAFPDYMVREPDTERARAARRLLAADDRFTWEEWQRAAFDTRVVHADENLSGLADLARAGLRAAGPDDEDSAAQPRTEDRASDPDDEGRTTRARRRDVLGALDELRRWDHVATVESVPTTLYVLWWERLVRARHERAAAGDRGDRARADDEAALAARTLTDIVEQLMLVHGTWRVAWGDVNRLQRIASDGEAPFDDDAPSLPLRGVPSWAGSMFTYWSAQEPGTSLRYARGGNSYVSVVDFSTPPRLLTLHTFGQSADPASPHYLDQSTLYAAGGFKRAPLTLSEVRAAARRSYRPGAAPDSR